MRALKHLSIVVLCVLCASGAAAAELGVLAPVIVDGDPLMKRDAHDRAVPVVTRVTSGALYDKLQKEAKEGFTATVFALDELAQRRAGIAPVPTWLYLAVEDGGFARSGFWLREEHGERFVPDAFVDLVVDADTVANGGFEEIFTHEMGHVFLRRLFPNLPFGYSRTPHMSFNVTDYPTAFDEGFATHFQPLVRRLTRNAALHDEDLGLAFKPFVPYWLSNLDRSARTDGATANASLTPRVESAAARGRAGDMKTFVSELTACRKAMAELRESVLKNPSRSGAALGPNIWLLSDAPMGGPDKQAKPPSISTRRSATSC